MNLKELIAKLPETDRGEAEKVIGDAIAAGNPLAGVNSKEAAAEFIGKNAFFKAALDSEISLKIAAHDERFQKEKLPGLVDAKMRELNPPKDPRDIEIAEIKKQLADRDRRELEAKQRELALKLAASEGVPVEDIERFIADNDDATTAQVKAYAGRVKAFADAKVEAALKERLGNNGQPRGGGAAPPPGDLESQYTAAVAAGNADLALVLQGKLQAQAASKPRS